MTEHQKSFRDQSSENRLSSSVAKKRKRSLSSVDDSIASDEERLDHGNHSALLVEEHAKHQTTKVMAGVRLPDLIHPTSLYQDYEQKAIPTFDSEEDVLKSALVRTTSCLSC